MDFDDPETNAVTLVPGAWREGRELPDINVGGNRDTSEANFQSEILKHYTLARLHTVSKIYQQTVLNMLKWFIQIVLWIIY